MSSEIVLFLLLVINSVTAFWMRGCEDSVKREKKVSCLGDNCQERLYQNSVKTQKECEKKVPNISDNHMYYVHIFYIFSVQISTFTLQLSTLNVHSIIGIIRFLHKIQEKIFHN